MLSMAWAALRSRRAQSAALTLLACLVIAGVAATPYYLFAASDRLVARDQRDLPASQRQADISQQITSTNGVPIADQVDQALRSMRGLLRIKGMTARVSLVAPSTLSSGKALRVLNASLTYLDGVCAHVTVRGRCPASGVEAMVSADDAKKLNLDLGDEFTWPNASVVGAPKIKLVGVYQPIDPNDPYWGANLLVSTQPNASDATGDAAFLTLDAIKRYAAEGVLTYRVTLPVGRLSQIEINDIDAQLADAQFQAPRMSSGVTSSFGTLVDRVNRDVNNLLATVPVLACETLALGWFALFLVVRASVANRRADTGLARLRGVPRGATWLLMSAQTALPVLIAAPIGAVAGYLGARALAGPVSPDERLLALLTAAGAGVLVVAGALLAALGASRRGRGGPILEMLRDTPPRRRGWRSDATDVVVLSLAVFAIAQSHSASAQAGLVIVAPGLTALAIALIVARAIAPISARLIPPALRSGRVGVLLTATHLARRPGLDRVFTLLTIVTALAANAIVSWQVAAEAQRARAHQDVGAARVIQLRQTTPGALLALTHAIDPSGRHLMAAAEFVSDGGDRVLAVDSPRFAAVAPGALSPDTATPDTATPAATAAGAQAQTADPLDAAELGRLLRPPAPSGPTVTGAVMTLTIDGRTLAGAKDTYLIGMVSTPEGDLDRLAFGPVRPGSHDYSQTLTGCATGCRIISYTVAAAEPGAPDVAAAATAGAPGTSLVLERLNGEALPASTKWRTTLAGDQIGPVLADAPSGGLAVSIPAQAHGGAVLDTHVYPLDTPVPVPVVAAGSLHPGKLGGSVTFTPFGGAAAPVSIQRVIGVIPRLGREGIIVDLGYADLLSAGSPTTARLEVWAAADTPPSMVKAVERAGPPVVAVETISGSISEHRADSLQSAREYALLSGGLGLMLGVIALLLVAAGERRSRGRELAALRAQGVTERTMRAPILAGHGVLGLGAVVLGVLAAMLGRALAGGQTAIFADGWSVVRPPSPWSASGWLIAAAAVAAPVAVAVALVTGALRRDVARRLKVVDQ